MSGSCKKCGGVLNKWSICPPCKSKYRHEYHLKNREYLCSKARVYYHEHKAQVIANYAEYQKQWYLRNKARIREAQREYNRNNPDMRGVHKHNRRAREAQCNGRHTAREWRAVLKKHGGACAHCGSKSMLSKDHIVPLARGGTNYAFNLQPLCKSCNSKKATRLPPGTPHSLFDGIYA